MNTLRSLSAAVALIFVVSLSVFAGEIQTPPCTLPEPGEIQTPPCAAQTQVDDSTVPAQVGTPAISRTIDMPAVAEAAMDLMLLF